MTLPWLEEHKSRLASALDQQRLGHAPLITGPSGVGKSELAEWLVRRILCLEPDGREPCGRCRSCELIPANTHPDFFRVGIPEDKKEIPVDSVRDLSASLQLSPRIGPHRAGLIEIAEAMNLNAANALLKTLEEPSGKAWLVLLSDQPGRLPATIRSRCQAVPVRPPDQPLALDWLKTQCPDSEPGSRSEALALTSGAPLAARSLLENQGLEFGRQVLDGLLQIAAGQPVTQVLGEQWQQSPESTWRWLAIWISAMMHQVQGAGSDRLPPGTRLPSVNPRNLSALWESALRGRDLTRTSARQDLLLGKWLLEWQTQVHPEN